MSASPLRLPYGETSLEVDPRGPAVSLKTVPAPAAGDVAQAARLALESPVGSPGLEQLARGIRKVVVVLADGTRRLSQGPLLEVLLEALEGKDVKLLVGSGLHGPSAPEELGLPEKLCRKLPLFQHQASSRQDLVELGPLRVEPSLDGAWLVAQTLKGISSSIKRGSLKGLSGRLFRGLLALRASVPNRLWINRLCAEADLIVALGQITPHFLTGYSGGIKAVVPGAAGRQTIVGNHLKFLHDSARLGQVEGNVVREELESAVGLLPPIFILNVVPAANGGVLSVVAGDPVAAHRAGLRQARSIYEVSSPRAEAVLVGAAYPRARDLFQLLKVLPAAARVVRPGGAICVAGPCPRGLGAPTLLRQILFPCYMESILPPGVELLLLSGIPGRLASRATPFRPVASLAEAVERLRRRAGPEGLLALMDGTGPVVPLTDGYKREDPTSDLRQAL